MARKRRTDSAKPQRAWPGLVAEISKAAGAVALRALPLVLVLVGTLAGVVALWSHAMKSPAYRIAGDTLSLSGSVRFCRQAVAEVERLGRLTSGRSLLDPRLLGDIRVAYGKSPWVRRVCGLRRVFPNRVSVSFILRTPKVQVVQSGYHWMVDDDGILLPVPGTRKAREGLPMVRGAIIRRPRDGEYWNDRGVRDALSVVTAIEDSPLCDTFTVESIDVSRGSYLDKLKVRRLTRPRIVLKTRENVTIRWGTFNSGDIPDEILTSEKIAMLRNLVARDLARIPGICLDVRTRVPGYDILKPGARSN